jgi:hypothetical protein
MSISYHIICNCTPESISMYVPVCQHVSFASLAIAQTDRKERINQLKRIPRYKQDDHILSSLHRLRVFAHACRSSIPCSRFIPIPMPLSTHCLLPISVRRESARAKANRSSSPLKMDVDLRADMLRPRSSIRLRMSSGSSSASSPCWEPGLDSDRESLISALDRRRFCNGTAVVRTSLAWYQLVSLALRCNERNAPCSRIPHR